METASTRRPNDGWGFVRIDAQAPNDVVKLDVGPVVFNVPEKANAGNADLYIAVEGCIVLEGDMAADKLKTKTFATNIGYFQLDDGKLMHVYGAHYDMDEERPGHPVFHAQIGPQMALGEAVKVLYHLEYEIEPAMGRKWFKAGAKLVLPSGDDITANKLTELEARLEHVLLAPKD